jgi:hypothetical protein
VVVDPPPNDTVVAFIVPIFNAPADSLSKDTVVILFIDALRADKLSMDTLNIDALLAVILFIDALRADKLSMDTLNIETLLAVILLFDMLVVDKLSIDTLNMDALLAVMLSVDILFADKLSIDTLNMETLLAVILSVDKLVADKLVMDALVADKLLMDALFITAKTDTFICGIIFTPLDIFDCDAKLFIAVVTYAVVAALIELSLGPSVGAVNETVKLLLPVHVFVEPSKLVPAFNVVCTYE